MNKMENTVVEEPLICQRCGKVVRCLTVFKGKELCEECWVHAEAGIYNVAKLKKIKEGKQ